MQFDGEDIVEINTVQQADAEGRRFPQNMMRLKILNNGRFSLIHNDSEARHLHERQLVEYTHGVFSDNYARWSHVGNYYLNNWAVRENHVDFTAYGRTRDLGTAVYRDSSFGLFTLGQIARHVAASAGCEVVVPRVMDNSPLFPRFFGNVTHRAALSAIAQVASCLLFEDKEGRICFVDALDTRQGSRDVLDYENMFEPPRIGLGTFYNGIMLTEKFVTLDMNHMQRVQVDAWGMEDITIPFDRPVYSGGWLRLTDDSWHFSVTNVQFHAMYMTARIQGFGQCNMEIFGNRANFAPLEWFMHAPWFDASQGQRPYVVDVPMFLQNIMHIAQTRNWFFARKFAMLAKRVVCDANWRQNPALGPGDEVSVQMWADGRSGSAHVLSQELNFNRGVLRGNTRVITEQG